MDPQDIQARVEGFAQKLLEEAHGDPVRALGLLVLVLEGSETPGSEQHLELLNKIRKILLPESDRPTVIRAVQHLAGDMSWEGYQHCVRCGLVLARGKEPDRHGFPSGYVYQVGSKFELDIPGDFGSCDA